MKTYMPSSGIVFISVRSGIAISAIPESTKASYRRDLWDKVQAQLNSNLQTHRNRAKGQASSLLTGLVEDAAGDRFTPSFTIRRGRRYRYYVSQVAIKSLGGERIGPTRVPAHELEGRVTEKLVAFLKSDEEVFDRLGEEGESPALSRNRVATAKKLAVRLPSLPSDEPTGPTCRFPSRGRHPKGQY